MVGLLIHQCNFNINFVWKKSYNVTIQMNPLWNNFCIVHVHVLDILFSLDLKTKFKFFVGFFKSEMLLTHRSHS